MIVRAQQIAYRRSEAKISRASAHSRLAEVYGLSPFQHKVTGTVCPLLRPETGPPCARSAFTDKSLTGVKVRESIANKALINGISEVEAPMTSVVLNPAAGALQ